MFYEAIAISKFTEQHNCFELDILEVAPVINVALSCLIFTHIRDDQSRGRSPEFSYPTTYLRVSNFPVMLAMDWHN